jgi:D-alanine-D-alanine ligase
MRRRTTKAKPRPSTKKIAVLYNHDFDPLARDYVARADVEKTAHAVLAALDAAPGFEGRLQPVRGRSLDFLAALERDRPDAVFNLCESLDGRAENEALVPALLGFLRIPYTGSGTFALATALRKDRTKELLHASAVPTPKGLVLDRPQKLRELPFPVIVKPLREDGSLGISATSVAQEQKSLDAQVRALLEQYGQEDSDEYQGSMPRLDHRLSAAAQERIIALAQRAFVGLECKGYARVDLRLDQRGEPFVIDVNPNCDLSAQGGFSALVGRRR